MPVCGYLTGPPDAAEYRVQCPADWTYGALQEFGGYTVRHNSTMLELLHRPDDSFKCRFVGANTGVCDKRERFAVE